MSSFGSCFAEIREAARLPDRPLPSVTGVGVLPSAYAVTDLATASLAAAGEAIADLIAARHDAHSIVSVDRRLASLWFKSSLRPVGWELPAPWDSMAGDYSTKDGWIRLHTNAPHHRRAAMKVLGVADTEETERKLVAAAVAAWNATELENAVISAGGCAGELRSSAAWAEHPQGKAVIGEPLLHHETFPGPAPAKWEVKRHRPLDTIRVLDLTVRAAVSQPRSGRCRPLRLWLDRPMGRSAWLRQHRTDE